jgi:folate-binding protein YgfZ
MPESALAQSGTFDFSDWGVIELLGVDAADFLNRLSTLNFKKWDRSLVRVGAFLTGKSGVVGFGFFRSSPGGFECILPKVSVPPVLEHLEKLHFSEDLSFTDVSEKYFVTGVLGEAPPLGTDALWIDPWIPGLRWQLLPSNGSFSASLDSKLYNFLRTSYGMPRVGLEIDSTVMILEANLALAVDRNKGCYPGQEVVERIFTYGQVNRKLLPVIVRGDWQNALLPLKCVRDGRTASTLVSLVGSPLNPSEARGLAFIARSFWDSTDPLSAEGVEMTISL